MIPMQRLRAILKIALPVTVGVGSTFIMVLIDVAMIGRLGNTAIAALGLASFSFTFFLAIVVGVAPAVQGLVARRSEQKGGDPLCLPLNSGLLLVLILGVPLTLLCYLLAPGIFHLISSDPEVTAQATPYFKAISLSIIAFGMNSAFRGFWTGLDRAKAFMVVILIINCLNIFLNYVFIYGNFGAPALGTQGAGIASAIAAYTGTLIYFLLTLRSYRSDGFLSVKPTKSLLTKVFTIGLPDSMQELFFSLGYVVFYWMVGLVGTVELAATNVLVRVSLVLVIFGDALGSASSTLVSQALGRNDPEDAERWGWDAGKVGVLWITFLGLPLVFFPEWALSFFLTDSATIEMAKIPMQITGALTGIASLIYIFAYTLVSIGDGNRVLLISFATQWLFFLPVVWIIGPVLNYGLLEIWIAQALYGTLATTLITSLWAGGRWKTIEI